MNEKPNLAVKILGWIIVIGIFLGSYFKMQHWPFAAILIILSTFVYLAFYLPLWFVRALKDKQERLFIIVQFIFTFFFIVWQIFKLQHYPGGGILTTSLFWSVLVFFVPFTFYKIYRSGKTSLFKFNNLVFLFYLLCSAETTLVRTSESSVGTTSMELSARQAEGAYSHIQDRSKYLYDAFEKMQGKEQNPYYVKAQKLKVSTDSVERYLQQVKTNIERKVDGRINLNFDTMHISDIRGLLNNDIPTYVLVGQNPESPVRKKYSGLELKSVIDAYRDSTLNYVNEDEKAFLASGINLNTDDVDVDGDKESWVSYNFAMLPALTVLITITKLQYEVKNAEAQVLTDLLNYASKDNKDDLASKIADLGYKLDKEKKNEEIKNLQKDKELSQLRIEAKNEEIASAYTTIGWFVVIVVAFVVMVFFIVRSNILRKKLNTQLATQKQEIEEKNKDILDSITYAKRLQDAILPPMSIIEKHLPESFVLYKPKDIVAGDFYWMEKSGDSVMIAACDCTGHGVPGAMVSVVCSNALNRALNEFKITEPGKMLDKVRELVLETYGKSEGEVRDGMDCSFCSFNTKTKQVTWSGAYNPLWYVTNGEMKEITGDKQPIGKHDNPKPFTTHTITITPDKGAEGGLLYLFTDGYADQFGGPKGKKFKQQQLKDMLSDISSQPMKEQKRLLEKSLEEWKGNLEQVDDILIIGIKV